jgi:hypothetical protein
VQRRGLEPGTAVALRGRVFRVIAILVLAAACDDGGGGETPDAAPGDAAPTGQGNEPHADVVVNEVASAVFGTQDWIELANRGSATVDVSGWFVSDAADRLDHYYELPAGTTLAPGAYLIVWADDAAAGEGHHAPFELGSADAVFLLGPTGLTVDAFIYLAEADGRTLARVPDREGLFFPAAPSPGAANGDAP